MSSPLCDQPRCPACVNETGATCGWSWPPRLPASGNLATLDSQTPFSAILTVRLHTCDDDGCSRNERSPVSTIQPVRSLNHLAMQSWLVQLRTGAESSTDTPRLFLLARTARPAAYVNIPFRYNVSIVSRWGAGSSCSHTPLVLRKRNRRISRILIGSPWNRPAGFLLRRGKSFSSVFAFSLACRRLVFQFHTLFRS